MYTGFKFGQIQSEKMLAELSFQLGILKERLISVTNTQKQESPLAKNQTVKSAQEGSDKRGSENNKASLLEKIVSDASEEELGNLLTRFFPEEDLYGIDDYKEFSGRLISELRLEDTPISDFSVSSIGISTSSKSSEHYDKDFFLKNREKLYAHIDTQGGLGTGSHNLFVRWTRLIDNQVLLFEKKVVKSDSSKNWVSFTPDQKWQAGSYKVSFFTFDSALEKLATAQFFIHESP